MSQLPEDLRPLPTMPYDERPIEIPLDVEECRTALWRCNGNVTEAATLLKITPLRLRTFVNRSPYLLRELSEAKEQIVDTAETIVREALTDDEDKSRRDQMARFVLGSSMAKTRGWGSGTTPGVNINNKGGTIVVRWEDGTQFGGADPKTIEMDPEEYVGGTAA